MDTVTLDPEVAELLDAMPPMRFDADALVAIRANRAAMPMPPLSDAVGRTDHVVPGELSVTVRVHGPKGHDGALPCVYSMHGGGYILGSYVIDDARFDRWSASMPCVGVSVEYRLAPETPYPGPLEDCYAGLRWAYEHHEELGIDPDVPGHAAAARADDVTGLPPTLVIVGGADGFRDEDVEYALRLMRSGVATELHVLPGVPHGVQLAAGSSPAREWDDLVDGWVRRQLGE
jgi:acetyl esterase/lipase